MNRIRVTKWKQQVGRWWVCLLAACLVGGGGAQLQAGPAGDGGLTGGLRTALELDGVWEDGAGNLHVVPFNYFDRQSISVQRRFDLPANWPEVGYLYLGGLGWSGEVLLNDRLLHVEDLPFQEVLLPLDRDWLKEKDNVLQVNMKADGKVFWLAPKKFVGIVRSVQLMVSDSVWHAGKSLLYVDRADKAVLVAPWSSASGFVEDSAVVLGALQGLLSYPYPHPVCFPFPPSAAALQGLTDLGVRVLRDPRKADSLALYNAYPLHRKASSPTKAFWRHADGRPAPAYGNYRSYQALTNPPLATPDRMVLLLLLGTPLLCLLLVRLVAPRFYSQMLEFLSKTQIYLELIGNNKFLKTEQLLLINLFRILILAGLVSSYLYYLDLSGEWERLNVFSEEGLVYRWFAHRGFSGYQILLLVSGGLLGLHLVKYFFLNLAGGIFRLFQLGTVVQNLDVFASFPFVFLPLLPAPFIFFADSGVARVLLLVWYGLLGLYEMRRIVLIYAGLNRLFQFSTRLKILYICCLEILPWVILL